MKFIIGRQWCDSLFLLVLSLLFSVALKRTTTKKTNPNTFFLCANFSLSLGSCWHCTDCCAPVVFSSNLCWFSKYFFPPFFFFIYFGSANRSKDRQGHTTEHSNPVFLRLLVNLGCIRSSPLRMTCPPPPQISFFHVIDGWRLVSDIQNSAVVRLDCDTGRVHSSRPWVLHSRRSWLERRRKVGGRIWSGQIFRHLFFFTDWLAVKVITIITQGQVRYTGRQSTLYLSLFFFYCPGWPRLEV